MQASNPTNQGSSGLSFTGSSTISQIVSGIALVIILYLVLTTTEYIYKSITGMWKDRVEIFPDTYPSGSRMYTAIQNPTNPNAKTINISDNQRSGVEFSYSMFINLSSATFGTSETTTRKLYHILHKGYSKPYPLMGPGIFAWGDSNKIRVYMNCFDTWDNYTDIENIPVDKWFHLVVSCKGNTLYLYINGNLKNKVTLSGNTPPYQNYGDVYAFSSRTLTLDHTTTTSLDSDPEFISTTTNTTPDTSLHFAGSASGMISRVYYFSYALTYTEINSLINAGPSKVMAGPDMTISPYLSDTWWTNPEGP